MKLQRRIIFIIPYFGTLPKYFQLWLDSAEINNDLADFYIITDQNLSNYRLPNNVYFNYQDFDSFKKKIQINFNFKINLAHPYKLCDFRPAYGEIFNSIIKDYEFWGFCDVDVIFGRLKPFLEKYGLFDSYVDKIGCLGHLEIMRNTKIVNSTYKKSKDDKMLDYKYVFSRPYSYLFDEQFSFNKLAIENNLKVETLLSGKITPFADIYSYSFKFKRNFGDYNNVLQRCFLFDKKRGLQEHIWIEEGKSVRKIIQDCMYVHLQKRKMEYFNTINTGLYLIAPNYIQSIKSISDFKTPKEKKFYGIAKKLREYQKINTLGKFMHKITFKKFIKNNIVKEKKK